MDLRYPALLIGAAVMIAGSAIGAPVTVTPTHPATLALPPISKDMRVTGDAQRLVIAISGYQPARDGPVSAVVSMTCGDSPLDIGRFGIMPNRAFTPSDPARTQFFGISVPDDPACREASAIVVRLQPTAGAGQGASLTIAGIKWD